MNIVYTFPGQGAQYPGMLEELDQDYVDIVYDITGVNLSQQTGAFDSTVIIQLALLVHEVSTANKLVEEGHIPTFVAGHSIGAFSAAVIAKVVSFDDAVKMVYKRSKLMETSYPNGYGMGVVVGLTKQEVEIIVNTYHTSNTPVYLSNQNAELQHALSGHKITIQKVLNEAEQKGATKAVMLKVPIPSHSPLMNDVADQLLDYLKKFDFQDPKMPYLSNHNGRMVRTKERVKKDLVLNIAHPVKWDVMVDVCVESGAECFVEMPPGHTLTNLLKNKYPCKRLLSVHDIDLDGTLYLLNKWKENDDDYS